MTGTRGVVGEGSPDAAPRATATAKATSVVTVVYRNRTLDLGWVPDDAAVVIVHNDRALDPASVAHPRAAHVLLDANVGYGAGMNAGLREVTTPRVIVANPDLTLGPAHWAALTNATPEEIVTVPLDDADGEPTATVTPYPTPLTHLVTGYRLGRFVRRGTPLRSLLNRTTSWTRTHEETGRLPSGRWPLRDRYVGGALFSIDTERLRAVGGFDERYFLYFEEIDLCARLAARFPEMDAVLAATPPGIHAVGASSRGAESPTVRHHARSSARYAHGHAGLAWRATEGALVLRGRWLDRPQRAGRAG